MNSTVKTSGRFSKSRGLRASVPFFPLPHPAPSTFLFSPHFWRGPNVKSSFAQPEFCSPHMGTLATQAIFWGMERGRHMHFIQRYILKYYFNACKLFPFKKLSSNESILTNNWVNRCYQADLMDLLTKSIITEAAGQLQAADVGEPFNPFVFVSSVWFISLFVLHMVYFTNAFNFHWPHTDFRCTISIQELSLHW